MTKQAFLTQLRGNLSGLPREDLEERLTFYGDMIDDKVEDGIPEETAVDEIGSPDALASQIIAEIPFTKLVKEKITPKRKMKAPEIVLLALGSPLWLSLLIAAAAVLLSLYVTLWSVVLVFWACFVGLAAGVLAGLMTGVYFAARGNGLTGTVFLAAGLVCAGLCIFVFYGSKAATKGIVRLTKKTVLRAKSRFIKKEERS